jgi:hypothetical protein
MTREARIMKLGDTLVNINTVLDKTDLSAVSPKTPGLKLKFHGSLKSGIY